MSGSVMVVDLARQAVVLAACSAEPEKLKKNACNTIEGEGNLALSHSYQHHSLEQLLCPILYDGI